MTGEPLKYTEMPVTESQTGMPVINQYACD